MDIHEIRRTLKTKNIYEIPLRVAYYARVSSEKDEQLNSLNNQQLYYDNLIRQNKNWIFVDGYVDEGLSAITTKKRDNFHKMIADAKAGKFDFIITKEITRFARNTLDSIEFTRKLLSYGVAVLFQNDNINTLDEDSELRLTIMAGIAQDEVRKLSSRIKFGHSQAIKNGVVMGNSLIYGYEKQKGKLIINEAEAEMVRLIFELYTTGDYSTPKIENILAEKGYKNHKGGKINRRTVGMIITNPKYKGYYCGNKVKIVDMFTKQQKFLDSDEWIMYRDEETVPAIVSEELWEKANAIFHARSKDIKARRISYKTDNLFTGKLICAEHGTPFYLKYRKTRTGTNNRWVCSHKIKNGSESCQTVGLYEEELKEVLADVIKILTGDIDDIVEKYIQYIKQINNSKDFERKTQGLQAEIDLLDKKKERLLELNLDDKLSNEEFANRNNAYNDECLLLQKELRELQKHRENQASSISNIFTLKNSLKECFNSSKIELTSGIINTFIDKIYVSAASDNCMHLEIRLKLGGIQKRYISKMPDNSGSRSVNTNKKMIEAQQKQMAGK